MKTEGAAPENTPLKEGQLVSQGTFMLKRLLRDDVTGQVWLATTTGGKEELRELRFLPADLEKTQEELPRLRKLVAQVAKLEHPGLARIYGYAPGEADSVISQEYFDAPSLTDLSFQQEGRVFPEEWLTTWLPQVLDALEYGQKTSGLAHGHLKPQFILLNAAGTAKVLEFNVARVLRDILHPPGQEGGHAGATFAHASPERIAGKDMGLAEDVYSLGAILYELLAGEAPFKDAAATEPRPLNTVRKTHAPTAPPVSAHLVSAISGCLSANPKSRPASLAQLRRLLGLPTAKTPEPQPEPAPAPTAKPAPATKPVESVPSKDAVPATAAALFPAVEVAPKRKSPLPALAAILVVGIGIAAWKFTQTPLKPSEEAPGLAQAPAEPQVAAPLPSPAAPVAPVEKPVVAAAPAPAPAPAKPVEAKPVAALPPPALPPSIANPTPAPAPAVAPVGAPVSQAEEKLAHARQEEIRKLLSSANEFLQKGDFEQSLVNYSTVVSLTREYVGDAVASPDTAQPAPALAPPPTADAQFLKNMRDSAAYAWHGRGECHFEQGKYTDALMEFETAARINAANDQTQARIGQVLLELRSFDKAKVAIDKALQLNPNQANATLALGRWTVVKTTNYEEAIKLLDKAISLRPELAEAYYWKGKASGGLRNFEAEKENLTRSEAGFSQILEHRHLAGRWLAFRGSSRLWLNRFQAAADDFTEVVRILPNYGFGYANRGYAYLRMGQTQKAIQDLDQAALLEPELASNFVNRGDAYLRLGKPEKAAADYTRALDADPANPVAWHNRAQANLRLNRFQSAMADFDKAIELDPKSVMLYLNKASAQYVANEYPAAIRSYTKVIELDPKNALAYRDRGAAQFATGLYEEAIADLTKSLEINDKDALTFFRRGAALDANGKYEDAVKDYTKAIELNPKDAKSYKARADSYSTLSEFKKAEEDFRKGEELAKQAAQANQAYAPM
jgi:tetratricopeptide (TPR) repeat protein